MIWAVHSKYFYETKLIGWVFFLPFTFYMKINFYKVNRLLFLKLFVLYSSRVGNWRRQWHPTPVFLPRKSHGRRSLVGCSPWGREELDTTERLHFHFSLSCIGEGYGNPLQCSCLENPRDRGAWKAAVSGVAQSQHDWVTHIANQQCFDSFRWTVKGLSHTYTRIHSPPNFPPT